jgi:hypothetical protein
MPNEEPSSQRDGPESTELRDGLPELDHKAVSEFEINPTPEKSPLSANDGNAMILKPLQVSQS